MTVARATLTPPDDGRFSLASVGLADWNLEKIEPVAQIGRHSPACEWRRRGASD